MPVPLPLLYQNAASVVVPATDNNTARYSPTLTGSRVALTKATELVWDYGLPGGLPGASPWAPGPPNTGPDGAPSDRDPQSSQSDVGREKMRRMRAGPSPVSPLVPRRTSFL